MARFGQGANDAAPAGNRNIFARASSAIRSANNTIRGIAAARAANSKGAPPQAAAFHVGTAKASRAGGSKG